LRQLLAVPLIDETATIDGELMTARQVTSTTAGIVEVGIVGVGIVGADGRRTEVFSTSFGPRVLDRAWRTQHFCYWMTSMLHTLPGTDFDVADACTGWSTR
jgi:hypothetical protein